MSVSIMIPFFLRKKRQKGKKRRFYTFIARNHLTRKRDTRDKRIKIRDRVDEGECERDTEAKAHTRTPDTHRPCVCVYV